MREVSLSKIMEESPDITVIELINYGAEYWQQLDELDRKTLKYYMSINTDYVLNLMIYILDSCWLSCEGRGLYNQLKEDQLKEEYENKGVNYE